MLGRSIADPEGVEAADVREIAGLGLLEMDTVFAGDKRQTQTSGTLGRVEGALAPLSGLAYQGYEIHMGRAVPEEAAAPPVLAGGGNVYGTYVHGFFDAPEVADGVLRALCLRRGVDFSALGAFDAAAYRERQYDLLAQGVRESLDMELVCRILDRRV